MGYTSGDNIRTLATHTGYLDQDAQIPEGEHYPPTLPAYNLKVAEVVNLLSQRLESNKPTLGQFIDWLFNLATQLKDRTKTKTE